MIEILEGTHFKQQEELANLNISKVWNPRNSYQRQQEALIKRLFENE